MDRTPFELESFHHVYNRGTDKRVIFMNDEDRHKFILYLRVLNNTEEIRPSWLERQDAIENYKVDEPLTNIIAYCLMSNHFHLLLQERTEGGISKFMQRLGTAYTVYFNEKYKRSGALFQGRYKNRLIEDEAYLFHVINYIHFNPKDLSKEKITRLTDLLKFLDEYRWSSYREYVKLEPYSRILQLDNLKDYVEIPKDYRAEILEIYDNQIDSFEEIDDIKIEE